MARPLGSGSYNHDISAIGAAVHLGHLQGLGFRGLGFRVYGLSGFRLGHLQESLEEPFQEPS